MAQHRITAVDIYQGTIPMLEPFRISLGLITEAYTAWSPIEKA